MESTRKRKAYGGSGASGFTLIELLVVMTIIALLLAILVPVISRAHGAAKKTICATQQNEFLKTTAMYTAEYNVYPPSLANTPLPWNLGWSQLDWLGAGHLGWQAYKAPEAGLYYPYIKNTNLYLCPSDDAEVVEALIGQTVRKHSYSMNGRTGLMPIGKFSHISDSTLPLFFEEDLEHNLRPQPEGCFTGTDKLNYRHAGKSNVGFADGHVQHADYDPNHDAIKIYTELGLLWAKRILW